MNKYQRKFLEDCAKRTPHENEWLGYAAFTLFVLLMVFL
jgi:hypothetical protein